MVTHVNRNPDLWRQAMEFAKAGGSIDLTTMQRPETNHLHAIPAAQAVQEALAAGVPAARMTLSTDSGVPYPKLDASGKVVGLYMAGPDAILGTIRELVQDGPLVGRLQRPSRRPTRRHFSASRGRGDLRRARMPTS